MAVHAPSASRFEAVDDFLLKKIAAYLNGHERCCLGGVDKRFRKIIFVTFDLDARIATASTPAAFEAVLAGIKALDPHVKAEKLASLALRLDHLLPRVAKHVAFPIYCAIMGLPVNALPNPLAALIRTARVKSLSGREDVTQTFANLVPRHEFDRLAHPVRLATLIAFRKALPIGLNLRMLPGPSIRTSGPVELWALLDASPRLFDDDPLLTPHVQAMKDAIFSLPPDVSPLIMAALSSSGQGPTEWPPESVGMLMDAASTQEGATKGLAAIAAAGVLGDRRVGFMDAWHKIANLLPETPALLKCWLLEALAANMVPLLSTERGRESMAWIVNAAGELPTSIERAIVLSAVARASLPFEEDNEADSPLLGDTVLSPLMKGTLALDPAHRAWVLALVVRSADGDAGHWHAVVDAACKMTEAEGVIPLQGAAWALKRAPYRSGKRWKRLFEQTWNLPVNAQRLVLITLASAFGQFPRAKAKPIAGLLLFHVLILHPGWFPPRLARSVASVIDDSALLDDVLDAILRLHPIERSQALLALVDEATALGVTAPASMLRIMDVVNDLNPRLRLPVVVALQLHCRLLTGSDEARLAARIERARIGMPDSDVALMAELRRERDEELGAHVVLVNRLRAPALEMADAITALFRR